MYNLNLNVYVEQVNVVNSEPGNWDDGDEQALKDVVDPNTEFQVAENCGSVNPASPLESYGVPIPSPTRLPTLRRNVTDAIEHKTCDISKNGYSALCEGQDVNFKSSNGNSEMPQVHARTANHQSEMLRRSSQSRTALEPKVHNDSRKLSTKSSPHSITQGRQSLEGQNNVNTFGVNNGLGQINPLPVSHTLSNDHLPGIVAPSAHNSTSEQLAWAFRSARDRLETASNLSGCSSRFELESNYSEQADSMSTFSDVSGYEEELYRISRLLLQDAPNSFLQKHLARHPKYLEAKDIVPKLAQHDYINGTQDTLEMKENESEKIKNVYTQLHSALAEKEKFRLALTEVESKTNLEWQQKYQEVLRQKANLAGRLEMVQSEVETLKTTLVENTKKVRSSEEDSELEKLRHAFKEMCNKNQELAMQLDLSEAEKSRWKEEAQDSDSSNERLRIQLQELRIDTESKDGSIQGLKMKVADQHVEIQTLLQAKLKAESTLSTIHSEMDTVQKSSQWYREQLHACQAAKVKLHQELMASQTNVISYSHLIERLKREAENLQLGAMETQERAVREKDSLMRKLEAIRADMLEREATIMGQLNRDDTAVETITAKLRIIEESRANESNIALQDLEQQVDSLKLDLRDKATRIETLRSENAQLFIRLNNTQELMNEKELALQNLEIKFSNTEASNNNMSVNLKQKEELLLDLKNEKVALEVSLAAAAREKEDVDAAIVKLREEFSRISKSYQSMQAELDKKVRANRVLEAEIQEVVKLKQDHNESVAQARKVEDELNELRDGVSRIHDLERQVENLHKTIQELNFKLEESEEIKEHTAAKYDTLKETLIAREEQLFNQTKMSEVHSEELKSRDKLISDLNIDNSSLQDHVESLKSKISQLEELYDKTCKEVDFYNAQLSRANFVIEQFNLLCRGSEQENHHLKKLMKELETEAIDLQTTRNDSTTQTNTLNVNSTGVQVGDYKTTESFTYAKFMTGHQDDKKEIEMLKCSLRMSDVEKRDKQRRYETNIRTLLRKVKEHMRGRKTAEKALVELRSRSDSLEMPDALQAKVDRLEAEKEVAKRQYDELLKVVEQNETIVLELEKEMGKLAQKQAGVDINTLKDPGSFKDLASDIKVTTMNGQVSELEDQVRKQQIIIKELRKQIFVEKRNSSQLRKQVASLRMGMDTANDVLDSKKVELGRSEAMGELLRESNCRLQRALEKEQISHERCKQDLDQMTQKLEECKANEPILADQMKMLSYHLHQKTQETSNMQGMMLLLKNGWATTEDGLKRNISALKDEINSLCEELTSVRAEKFALQSEAVELRAALQSSRSQHELMQLKLDAYQNDSDKESGLPDLMSSLPSAPVKYDQLQIAELLNYSTPMPHNKPLSNLQNCLDSLKQEMTTLQQQVVAKTSGQSGSKTGKTVVNENGIKEV